MPRSVGLRAVVIRLTGLAGLTGLIGVTVLTRLIRLAALTRLPCLTVAGPRVIAGALHLAGLIAWRLAVRSTLVIRRGCTRARLLRLTRLHGSILPGGPARLGGLIRPLPALR